MPSPNHLWTGRVNRPFFLNLTMLLSPPPSALTGIQVPPSKGSPELGPMATEPLACQHLPFQQALSPIDQHGPAGAYRQALAFKGEAGAPCPWAKERLYFL